MNYIQSFGGGYGYGFGGMSPLLLVLLMVWSLFWKGLALWHAARRKQGWWFLAILIINTVGILEIVYLFAVAKIKAAELFDSKTKAV